MLNLYLMNYTANYLFLDLGTKTGWCLALHDTENPTSGVKNFKEKFGNVAQEYSNFRKFLIFIIKEYGINHIVYEKVVGSTHKGSYASHKFGGFEGHLMEIAQSYNIAVKGIVPTSIKYDFTGRGNAKKSDVIEECRRRGHNPADDNEADALAMFYNELR